jgi:DNA-binding NarL/FixJ family response regulator
VPKIAVDVMVHDALRAIAKDRRLSPVLEQRLFDLAVGMSYRDMSDAYGISMNTVKTEVRFVLRNVGVACSHELQSAFASAAIRAHEGATAQEIYDFLCMRWD